MEIRESSSSGGIVPESSFAPLSGKIIELFDCIEDKYNELQAIKT